MLLKLPSGLKIAIPPGFPWEVRHCSLRVQSRKAFYPGHVTTKLCLDLLDESLRNGQCRTVLDIGCGSGILALTAACEGVPFVVGLDTDPRAIEASRENAGRNGLSRNIHWLLGSAACILGCFDCVMANLPFGVIMGSLVDVVRVLEPDGHLILSGFQDIEYFMLEERLLPLGLEVEKRIAGDQSFYGVPPSGSFTWMAVLAKKNSVESSRA